jgi:hypothetical protein
VIVEIFVDFGLFEILAASGLAALAKAIYARPVLRATILAVSVVTPAALLLLVTGEALRWIAAAPLGTSLVNLSMILSMIRARTAVR